MAHRPKYLRCNVFVRIVLNGTRRRCTRRDWDMDVGVEFFSNGEVAPDATRGILINIDGIFAMKRMPAASRKPCQVGNDG